MPTIVIPEITELSRPTCWNELQRLIAACQVAVRELRMIAFCLPTGSAEERIARNTAAILDEAASAANRTVSLMPAAAGGKDGTV